MIAAYGGRPSDRENVDIVLDQTDEEGIYRYKLCALKLKLVSKILSTVNVYDTIKLICIL